MPPRFDVGWLQILVFLLSYSILDRRFGKTLKCSECGHEVVGRRHVKCPACASRLITARTSIVQLAIALLFLLIWMGSAHSRIWYYSGTRYYFFIGQGSMGLDRGIHYGLGPGLRDYVPGFGFNVFYINFGSQFAVVAVVIVLWNLLLFLERSMRRKPEIGRCACGYNLTGNVSGVCPECGQPVATAKFA
jgi:hypothetical protein